MIFDSITIIFHCVYIFCDFAWVRPASSRACLRRVLILKRQVPASSATRLFASAELTLAECVGFQISHIDE